MQSYPLLRYWSFGVPVKKYVQWSLILLELFQEVKNADKSGIIKKLNSQSKDFLVENNHMRNLYEKLLSYVEAVSYSSLNTLTHLGILECSKYIIIMPFLQAECEKDSTTTMRDLCGQINLLRRENTQLRSHIQQFTQFLDVSLHCLKPSYYSVDINS